MGRLPIGANKLYTDGYRYYFPKVVKNNNSLCKVIYFAGVPRPTYTNVGTRFEFITYP